MWEISERFPMPAAAKKTAAAQAQTATAPDYRPEFVARVKAVAAEPGIGPMTGEEALARLAALTKGANG